MLQPRAGHAFAQSTLLDEILFQSPNLLIEQVVCLLKQVFWRLPLRLSMGLLDTTMPATANFNLQTTQGGAVFTPDGSAVLAAYNILPAAVPALPNNTSQLTVNNPDTGDRSVATTRTRSSS